MGYIVKDDGGRIPDFIWEEMKQIINTPGLYTSEQLYEAADLLHNWCIQMLQMERVFGSGQGMINSNRLNREEMTLRDTAKIVNHRGKI